MAKFATNACGSIWWPNLELMQVAPSCGQFCNYNANCATWWSKLEPMLIFSWRDNQVKEAIPWVRCAFGNVYILELCLLWGCSSFPIKDPNFQATFYTNTFSALEEGLLLPAGLPRTNSPAHGSSHKRLSPLFKTSDRTWHSCFLSETSSTRSDWEDNMVLPLHFLKLCFSFDIVFGHRHPYPLN